MGKRLALGFGLIPVGEWAGIWMKCPAHQIDPNFFRWEASSQRQNRYLVRQLCWVLTIEGGFVSQQESLGKAIPVKYRVENSSLAHRPLELVMRRRIAWRRGAVNST
jgi:hypothetical protein